jgi:beta-xylosidase
MRRACAIALLTAAIIGVGGCNSAETSGPTSDGSGSTPGTMTNPVIDVDFPDPFVLQVDGEYWAYSTGAGGWYIQVARSADLIEWELVQDALPALPTWQIPGYTWAPEVASTSAGLVMYYTTRDRESGRQCISTAVSEVPEGPFTDESSGPLICQVELGGSIDATHFTDIDGTTYLIWKNDGNCCGLGTEFWAQPLTADGLGLAGEPTNLGLVNDRPWEGNVIEAPTLWLADDTYYLFYSANNYAGPAYAVGYATASTVLGPYTKASENPILATSDDAPAAGPGHQSIVEGPGGDLWLAYHAWDEQAIGYEVGGVRTMWLDELILEDGMARVEGPDSEPQPVP